jgi:hypothetical protein
VQAVLEPGERLPELRLPFGPRPITEAPSPDGTIFWIAPID